MKKGLVLQKMKPKGGNRVWRNVCAPQVRLSQPRPLMGWNWGVQGGHRVGPLVGLEPCLRRREPRPVSVHLWGHVEMVAAVLPGDGVLQTLDLPAS